MLAVTLGLGFRSECPSRVSLVQDHESFRVSKNLIKLLGGDRVLEIEALGLSTGEYTFEQFLQDMNFYWKMVATTLSM